MIRWHANLGSSIVTVFAFIAYLVSLNGCGNSTQSVPPYSCALRFERAIHSPPEAYTPDMPIMVYCQLFRVRPDAPQMDMRHVLGDPTGPCHWLRLAVTDPDGLAYLWERHLTEEDARREEERLRRAPNNNLSFTFDLRQWAPSDFQWKSGEYRFVARATAGGRQVDCLVGVMFMKEVPADAFHHAFPALLSAELEANGADFSPGETIVLRGYLKNQGDQPFMVLTREPFRYTSLVAEEGHDTFPSVRPTGLLRLSHFTRIEPGQRLLLFEEPFVAGHSDPHWSAGMRWEWFPPPFAPGMLRTICFELRAQGDFPEDRQPSLGIWTGLVNSNRVTITVTRPTDKRSN